MRLLQSTGLLPTSFSTDGVLGSLANSPIGGALQGYMASTATTQFFSLIRKYVINQFEYFGLNAMENIFRFCSVIGITLLTMQIMWKGYELSTGQSRGAQDTMMKLMKSMVVMIFVTTASFFGQNFYNVVIGLQDWIVGSLSGGVSPYDKIDKGLAKMQGLLAIMNSVDTAGNAQLESKQTMLTMLTTGGVAGPSIIAGSLLMLNQIAILLFCAFSPLFIMSLMFEQTKGMFWQWLKYGVSTMFTMGVLTITSMIIASTVNTFAESALKAFLVNKLAFGVGGTSLTAMAMQQGGLGLVMTALILTVPNMVGQFFGGALGNFQSVNAFQGYHGNNQNNGNNTSSQMSTNGANSAQVQQHSERDSNNRVNRNETAPPSLGYSTQLNHSNNNQQTDAIKLKTGPISNGAAIAAKS